MTRSSGEDRDPAARLERASPTVAVPRELVAALHAGTLDREQAREARARIRADPAALRYLGELDQLRDSSRDAASDGDAAAPQGAAVAASAPSSSRSSSPPCTAARSTASTRWWRRSVVVMVAAVALGAGMVVAAAALSAPPPGRAAALPPVPVVAATQLGSLYPGVTGFRDFGFLGKTATERQCIPAPDIDVLGARPVVVDGRYGVLVAYVSDDDEDDPDTVHLAVYAMSNCLFVDEKNLLSYTEVRR